MKKLVLIGIILVAGKSAAAQTITVESDKRLNTEFNNYKTFNWSSQVDRKLDEGSYFLNDLILKANVREAVKTELQGLGYKKTKRMPDLIVNFRVFDKPATLKGYEGYGHTYWSQDEIREPEDATTYEVKAGTVLINLVDRESGQMIWQGFASGLLKNNTFNKDEGKIKEAVNLIFNEFPGRATEYSRR